MFTCDVRLMSDNVWSLERGRVVESGEGRPETGRDWHRGRLAQGKTGYTGINLFTV